MKTSLLIPALLLSVISNGQAFNFSTFTTAYSEFSNGTQVNENDYDEDSWDDPFISIDLGFEFQMGSNSFSQISQEGLGSDWFLNGTETLSIISYASDLIDGDIAEGEPGSEISYTIEGIAGNRICKIQYKDCAFYAEVDEFGTADNRVSFQIWLYESDYSIEFRFGPHTITNNLLVHEGLPGAVIALVVDQDISSTDFNNAIALTGDPTHPVVSMIDQEILSLNGNPENGRVYRFEPSALAVDEISQESFKIFPTLAEDFINISTNLNRALNYRIYSMNGKMIKSGQLNSNERIDISTLEKGSYFLSIQGLNGAQKFMKF